MNEIVNKFLLAGDKFMPEMYLKQPGYIFLYFSYFSQIMQQNQILKTFHMLILQVLH